MKLGTLIIDENQMVATLLATAYVAPHGERFYQTEDGRMGMRSPSYAECFAEAVQQTEEFMTLLKKRVSAEEAAAGVEKK